VVVVVTVRFNVKGCIVGSYASAKSVNNIPL